ncbi:unnamed protein product [Mytilus coruscus]|uniref:CARD domain-containing protein n=1 Tax=Mytilus coruscus TaxID=42192 RepID=A0A6J8AMM5_MYTCO|nr:unnamed protein product [Mytilus coruscus]
MHLDPVECKSQLENAAQMIDQIQFEGFMEELIECFIFSVNDYNNITKESASNRNDYVISLLIKYLHKGSFECFLKNLKKSSSPAMSEIKGSICPAISLRREEYSDYYFTDADTKICQTILSICIPENSHFNDIITRNIRDYSKWFIHEFGMYPTTIWDCEENSNKVITLQTLCSDSSHRIKESFEKDGFTELLERLICRTKVVETFTNEEEKLEVEMCFVYEKRNKKEYTFKDTPDIIDDVEILKANKTYLVNEMETADMSEIFNGYQDFKNFDQSAEKIDKNLYILNTILRHPTNYLERFKHQIEQKDTCRNIRKRLEETRYVYGKKIETETLRSNIIENVIHLLDLPFDTDEFQSKYEDRNIFTNEEFKSFGSKDLNYVLLIVETLKSGRKAMLTFVDCLFQRADIGMAETLLVERKSTLNRGN